MTTPRTRSALDLGAVSAALGLLWLWLIPGTFSGRVSQAWVVAAGALLALHIGWVSPRLVHAAPGDPGLPRPRSPRGLRGAEARASWRFAAAVTLAGAAALVAGSLAWGPRPAPVAWPSLAFRAASYLPSATVQAWLFFGFYLARLRDLLPPRWAAAATAIVFAGFHLPNLPLATLALAAGLVWGLEYVRRPNLPALVLSHALLGTVATQLAGFSNRAGPFVAHADRYLIRDLLPWWGALADRFLPRVAGG